MALHSRPVASRCRLVLGIGLSLGAVWYGHAAVAQTPDSLRFAHVTYVTLRTVYIDAGRDQDVWQGTTVEVLHGNQVTATLRVTDLTSQRAACTIVRAATTITEGDTVRYVAGAALAPSDVGRAGDSVAPAPSQPVAAAAPTAQRSSRHPSAGMLRGRVGIRYLAAQQHAPAGGSYAEPSLDLRLDGAPTNAVPVGLTIDVRAHRVSSQWADGTRDAASHARVYQAAASWQPARSPFRLSVGRLYTPAASLSLIDGAMFQVERPTWSAGVLTGSEPGLLDLSLSGEIRDYGAYAELHAPPAASARWAMAAGAIGSYSQVATNREFAFVHARYTAQRVSFVVTQEVDYYRPWKVAAGESAISPTSTFATLYYQVADALSVHAGVDNRRTVRLYRDMTTPETAFDDSFRRGLWAGVSGRLGRQLRLGLDARTSNGIAGAAAAYTASLGADRVPGLGLGVRLRSTRYTNPQLAGWLHALALSAQPTPALTATFNAGLRSEHNPLDVPADLHVAWFGVDADFSLARSWYLTMSVNAERGTGASNDQLYGGLSYRF